MSVHEHQSSQLLTNRFQVAPRFGLLYLAHSGFGRGVIIVVAVELVYPISLSKNGIPVDRRVLWSYLQMTMATFLDGNGTSVNLTETSVVIRVVCMRHMRGLPFRRHWKKLIRER